MPRRPAVSPHRPAHRGGQGQGCRGEVGRIEGGVGSVREERNLPVGWRHAIAKRDALLKVLDKPHLDLTTPLGRGFIAFLSAMAEDERLRIHKRAGEGRAAAKARGVHMGRRPKLSDHQQSEALDRLAKGETCRAIARTFGVHHSTVSRLAG
jgi:hypothetical protein